METNIRVRPLSWLARFADRLVVPLMYFVSLSFERPQQTHRWNNQRLQASNVAHLSPEQMVACTGIPNASPRFWLLPIFHTPIFGGWRNYAVLLPAIRMKGWHVGWITEDVIGVSRIPLDGPVRLLIGPGPVKFFGISQSGTQIPLQKIGSGVIGKRGEYSHTPLL